MTASRGASNTVKLFEIGFLCVAPGATLIQTSQRMLTQAYLIFRSPLKQSKKRASDGCFYGRLKTEFRGGERRYHKEFGRQLRSSLYHPCRNEEFEVSQHEKFLENLNMNSKALKNSETQVNQSLLQILSHQYKFVFCVFI